MKVGRLFRRRVSAVEEEERDEVMGMKFIIHMYETVKEFLKI